MINSPCLNCPGKNLPKDSCIKQCEKLQELQGVMAKTNDFVVSNTENYSEETTIIVNGREFAY